jgi:CheY-like chemotaxis protein
MAIGDKGMPSVQKIALVDDNAEFVASNKDMLEAFGYQVVTALNGEEALRLIPAEKPDLVILDISMTYATEGLDVARKLRADPTLQGMKIMIVSGVVSQYRPQLSSSSNATGLPVERVLEKPIDPPVLMAEIEKLLKST